MRRHRNRTRKIATRCFEAWPQLNGIQVLKGASVLFWNFFPKSGNRKLMSPDLRSWFKKIRVRTANLLIVSGYPLEKSGDGYFEPL